MLRPIAYTQLVAPDFDPVTLGPLKQERGTWKSYRADWLLPPPCWPEEDPTSEAKPSRRLTRLFVIHGALLQGTALAVSRLLHIMLS